MKVKWLSALPIIFAVMFIALPSWAGTQLWDFEKAAQEKEWTVANGQWQIKNGVYQETSAGEAAMHTIIGEEKWDDYVLEGKVRMDQGNWAGLLFRAQSEFEYYIYYMNVPDNKSELWKHNPGAFDARNNLKQIPAVGKVKIVNKEWFNFKVVVEGDQFQLWINDELQSEDKDNSYKTGKIGIWAWQTKASFDDITVTGDNVKHTLAVEPRNKLAITWGKLKQTN